MLQSWAVATVIVVILLGLMANYAKSLIDDTRHVLAEQVLPLESSSRALSNVTTAFSHRQKQVLASENLAMLEQFRARGELEQQFEQNWLRLSRVDADDPDYQQLAESLFSYYQDFLVLDQDVYSRKQQSLELNNRIKQHSDDIDIQAAQVLSQVEQLDSRLSRSAADSLKLISQAVYQLSLLNYQSFTISSDEKLAQIQQQQLVPIQRELESQLAKLKRQLGVQSGQLRAVERLAYDSNVLVALIQDQDGLYPLHKQRLLNKALLKQAEESAGSVMKVLIDKVNKIADMVNQQSYQAVNHNVHKADQTRWQIVLLTILITVGMAGFAWLLFRSINNPLSTIKQSIHNLSEGQFDTRMTQTNSKNELSLLASDFNQFAENTENLFDTLNDTKQSLHDREQHIRAILNGVPEAILTLSEDGVIVDINAIAEQVLGGAASEICGLSLLKFFEAEEFDSLEAVVEQASQSGEFEGQRLDGSSLSMWLSMSQVESLEGNIWVCVISDVTAWKQADRQLQQMSVEQDAILENAIIGIAFVRDREFVRVNHRFEQLFGYYRDEIIGQSTVVMYPNEQAFQQFGEQAYVELATGESFEAQLELVKHNGDKFWCAISGKAIDPSHPMEGTIWLFEDVTQQRENEEHLTKLASIDALTGLPNRTVFKDRLEHAIHKARRDAGRLAVFFLDLDHFKQVNDSLGHRAGDVLLKEVANRIKSCLREGDTVARLGGDEFTLLLEDVRSAEYVGKVAEKVIRTMSRPYSIESTEVTVSPSIGVSLYPADGRDVDMLIRNADAAMYHAKKLGRNNFQFYSVEMNAEAAERMAMETALRRAVDKQEFFLHYQLQYDLKTGAISGAEVLLRWQSDEWGMVSPAQFVPMLEDSGLITQVGDWVLRQACETFLEARDQLPPDFMMAVNLSGRQFKGGGLAENVRQLLNDTGMPTQNLELEITETMLMEDTELATLTLRQLSEMGITLAIDDFGTGYSSLSYLKQFPLNVLKIDGAFIQDITTDSDSTAIVDAIMAMSERLGLTVVAEGVEHEAQLNYLKQRYCQRAQGYLFGKPVDKSDFMALVSGAARI